MAEEASTPHFYSTILDFKMNKANPIILFISKSAQVRGDFSRFMGVVITLLMSILLLSSVLPSCQVPLSAFYPCHHGFSHQLPGLVFFRQEKQGEKN